MNMKVFSCCSYLFSHIAFIQYIAIVILTKAFCGAAKLHHKMPMF